MEKKYCLNLYDNAIDSLNVGMRIYNDSLEDKSMYKFCIIIISNFMELILKHMVKLQNPLLCFEKPHSSNINKEKTITWRQALQILTNSHIIIEKELIIVIERLSDIRNKIIHYKFEYTTSEIRAIIVWVIDGLRKLYTNVTKQDFIDDVFTDTKKSLEIIEDEYKKELHLAQANAEEENGEGIFLDDCNFCGEIGTAVHREHDEIYCYFCEETDYEIECCRCTGRYKISEMEYFSEDENGDDLFLCQHCSGLLSTHGCMTKIR
jgi:hypothetical protein